MDIINNFWCDHKSFIDFCGSLISVNQSLDQPINNRKKSNYLLITTQNFKEIHILLYKHFVIKQMVTKVILLFNRCLWMSDNHHYMDFGLVLYPILIKEVITSILWNKWNICFFKKKDLSLQIVAFNDISAGKLYMFSVINRYYDSQHRFIP